MGCHTWFYRPITEEEYNMFKDNIQNDISCILEDNELYSLMKKEQVDSFKEECEETKKIIYDSLEKGNDLWLELGWGTGENRVVKIKGKFYLQLNSTEIDDSDSYRRKILIPIPREKAFHDVFRVKNYPSWVIHNKRELRRKMRKKYFDLTQEQLDRLHEFWQMYPDGIITFG